MTDTPPRLRSFAPPTRDKMIIWSAVVAGCGIMALLGRHAAIYRFGTDYFTGNILFAVFFILLIGLYVSIQPVFETIFKRLFPQRTPAIMVAEMPNGEQVAIPANDESVEMMQCTSDASTLEYENTHVRVQPHYGTPVGCFSSIGFENRIPQDNGKFLIEHEEHDVYVSADGQPYFLNELEEALKAYEIRKEHGEIPDEILVQKKQCETAHKELQEEDMKFSLAQIEFLCAYITHMMQPYLEVDELHKLHHNAKIWTVNAAPPFTPVNLRSNHLTKEDLKHLGYNVGKFLRLQCGAIARFVKKVFEKPFESTNVRTIEQKLRESKSTKERIPVHTADQMDKLFAHFQRYGNINPGILNKK